MLKVSNARRGFTLVELSIVLVIIGLIIGGVLTGQQIIQNARIANAVNAIQAYQGQFQTYAQNYGALPGDDTTATTRFPNAGLSGNGNGDGQVGNSSSFNTTSTEVPAVESRLAWADMRAAGLIKNQAVNEGQPANPFGGIFGFQHGGLAGAFTSTVLCMNSVPGAAAQAIDARLDDGSSNAGAVQATSAGGGNDAAAANYSGDLTYTVCTRM